MVNTHATAVFSFVLLFEYLLIQPFSDYASIKMEALIFQVMIPSAMLVRCVLEYSDIKEDTLKRRNMLLYVLVWCRIMSILRERLWNRLTNHIITIATLICVQYTIIAHSDDIYVNGNPFNVSICLYLDQVILYELLYNTEMWCTGKCLQLRVFSEITQTQP